MSSRKSAVGEIVTGGIMIAIPFFVNFSWGHAGRMHMMFPLLQWGLIALGAMSVFRGSSRLYRKWRLHRVNHPGPKARKVMLENNALRAARKNRGRMTAAQAALDMNVPIEDAETALNDLVSRGHAEMDISPGGRIDYLFPDFTAGDHDTGT